MENRESQQDLVDNNKSATKGLLAWLRKWWSKLRGKTAMDEPSVNLQPVSTNDNLNKPYYDFEKNIKHFDGELIIPELQENFMTNKKFMFDCGRRDGVLGIKSEDIKTIAQTHAQNLFDLASVILNGKLAALKTELAASLRIKDRDEMNDKKQNEYYNYLQHGYRYFPRTFSMTLGFIYFICFIVLLIADIPLALRLILSGFNLKSDGNLPLLFVSDTFSIIKSNWEVFATAIGIAMCTVYIKIFYDEFIGTPYGSKYISRSKFFEIPVNKVNESDGTFKDTELNTVDNETSQKRRWKYGIAVFTVLALLSLALFRIHTLALFEINTLTGEQVLKVVPKGWQLDLAIMSITLIFPIISGICLSLALANFQNCQRLRSARKECTKCSKIFIKSLTAYTEIEKKCDNLDAELRNWDLDHKRVENHQGILMAHYAYGRSIGMAEPDRFMKEKDFYGKVELWRQKMVSRKINDKIIQSAIT